MIAFIGFRKQFLELDNKDKEYRLIQNVFDAKGLYFEDYVLGHNYLELKNWREIIKEVQIRIIHNPK